MAPPMVDLDPYREIILEWVRTNIHTDEMAKRLESQFCVRVKGRTIYRRLKDWKVMRRAVTLDTPFLRAQIAILFRLNCTDEEIVVKLTDYGYTLGRTAVVRIRKDLGLVRRMTSTDRKESDAQLYEILKREVADG